MELERHIEILLLDNDCVIVPGLGGFIAYHTDARYDSESDSFVPPTRVAGFNPKLSMNDNLLAQSYVETYDISYPEAVKKIAVEADMLKAELEQKGCYEISGVGTLRVKNDGGYDFEPFEAGLLTPEYYGLGCFEALRLSSMHSAETAEESFDKEEEHKSGKYIRIKVSTIRNVAAAAVAIFAFFLMSSPLGNSNKNVASVVGLQNGVFNKVLPIMTESEEQPAEEETSKELLMKDSETEVPESSTIETAKEEPAAEVAEVKTVEEPEAVKAEDYYCIVLASALSKNNAENFVNKLTSEGCSDIHSIDCSNGMKVVCGRYTSEKEARASLDTKKGDKNFKEAWIYKVKIEK